MSIRVHKIFLVLLFFSISFLMTACDGDSEFIPFPAAVEEEVAGPILITAGGTKGPLVNAEINFYSVDLKSGEIGRQGDASEAFFELLDRSLVVVNDDVVGVSSGTDATALTMVKTEISRYGYVSTLSQLQLELDSANSLPEGLSLVTFYLSIETNTDLKNQVQDAFDNHATLPDLNSRIQAIETFVFSLQKETTFSGGAGIVSEFSDSETDPVKLQGWEELSNNLDTLKASETKLSILRQDVETVLSQFQSGGIHATALEEDPVAKNRLEKLSEDVNASRSVAHAEELIDEAISAEGNSLVRSMLATLEATIVTFDDFIEEAEKEQALFNLEGLSGLLSTTQTLQEFYDEVTQTLRTNLVPALRDSFKSKKLIDSLAGNVELQRPENLLVTGKTNGRALVTNMGLGDYTGFVYVEVISDQDTSDLNTGQPPFINRMESIFHTNSITGNGNNSLEDTRLVYFKNGIEQRDEDGALITDEELIETVASDSLVRVRPYRFTTPLTYLALELALNRLKSFELSFLDQDGDGHPEYRVNENVLKRALELASTSVIETFGVGLSPDVNIFDAQPVITEPMQFSNIEQLEAAEYRAVVESFSAFFVELNSQLNISTEDLLEAIVKDLSDDEMDGLEKDVAIGTFDNVSDVAYLASRNPSEIKVPGTNFHIDELVELMEEQVSTMEPNFPHSSFAVLQDDLQLIAPKGGIDSDGDGVLNNSDVFPDDPLRNRDISSGYSGIWMININQSPAELMPLSGVLDYRLNVVEGESACGAAPCITIGNLQTPIIEGWKVISSPTGGDMQVSGFEDNNSVGFVATATVSGGYLLRGTFTTQAFPVQTFTTVLPITVLDPREIEIRFSPLTPDVGELISVEFKVTDELCRLYDFCNSVNRLDNIDDFLDIDLLNDFFHVVWRVRGDADKSYRSLSSKNTSISIVEEFDTQFDDVLGVEVIFNSGPVEFVSGNFESIVGVGLDYDDDGVANGDDFYPNDANCWRENDGVFDRDGDGLTDTLIECNTTFSGEAAGGFNGQLVPVAFENEEWQYANTWGHVFRKNLSTQPPTFEESISLFPSVGSPAEIISQIEAVERSRRVYLAYESGEIEYFSFEDSSLHDFVGTYNSFPVASITSIEDYVLVGYTNAQSNVEYKLYTEEGELAEIRADDKYPKPGSIISLNIDGNSIAPLTQVLVPVWTLSRLDGQSPPQPQSIPIQLTNDSLNLLTGQTEFGDLVEFSLMVDSGGGVLQEVSSLTLAVVDSLSFDFDNTEYSTEDVISLTTSGLDLNASLVDQFIYVEWLVNGVTSETPQHQFFDRNYPYSLAASNTHFGDIVTLKVFLEHGSEDVLIDSFTTLVIGNLDAFKANVDVSIDERNVIATVSAPTVNDQFFINFVPVWSINLQPVLGESSFNFPSNSDTVIKYGDSISVVFSFENNGLIERTGSTQVGLVTFDFLTSTYSLTPHVPEIGSDISFDFSEYQEDTLIGLIPRWEVNGVLDSSVNDFVYPGSNLKYGDHILLKVEAEDPDPDDNEPPDRFLDTAEVYIGLNVTDEFTETLDDDSDGTANQLDYFRLDSACFAQSEGEPDDADGDGVSDLDELRFDPNSRTNPNLADTDGDGLSDGEERDSGTDPLDTDTDADGFSDGFEVKELNTDPLDVNVPGSMEDDLDRDGILNEEELVRGTFVDRTDSDNDGLFDGMEILGSLTDPLNPDSDGDGLSDGLEVKVTLTDPLDVDSDGDGLSDGLEVRLLGLNPNSQDTDDDGVMDSGTGSIPANDYLEIGDLIGYAFGKPDSMVPASNCYVSWLGAQENFNTTTSNNDQIDSTSPQQVAFSAYGWTEILRYDARAGSFLSPLRQEHIGINVSAIEYALNDIDTLYLGYLNGQIRSYNEGTGQLTDLFDIGQISRVTNIVDQGALLLVEAEKIGGDGFTHFLFDKSLAQTSPVHSYDSILSYENSAWRDNSYTELWLVGNETNTTSLRFETIDALTPTNSNQSADQNVENYALQVPIFVEQIQAQTHVRLGSGHALNLDTNQWTEGVFGRFAEGFQHAGHRVTAPLFSGQVQLDLQTELDGSNGWETIEQLTHDNVVSILPLGEDVLAISRGNLGVSQNESITPLAFDSILVGDSDGDGLPGWWESYAGSDDTVDDAANFIPPGSNSDTTSTITYGDAFNQFIYNRDNDSDRDGLSDLKELTETFTAVGNADTDNDGLSDSEEMTLGTDPNTADTDGDGLLDGQEVNLTSTDPNNADSDGNGTNDGDEDTDGDTLSDAEELNLTETDHTLADTNGDGQSDTLLDRDGDGLSTSEELAVGTSDLWADTDDDGLSDYEEVNGVRVESDGSETPTSISDPTMLDSDSDGLTDYQEVVVTLTDPLIVDTDGNGTNDNNEDVDGDGLSAFDEFAFGTNVFVVDSDGDGLNDGNEVSGNGVGSITDPARADTDGDGLNDSDELSITNTDPALIDSDGNGVLDGDEDTDGDGLTDSEELNQLNPAQSTDLNVVDANSDLDNDGVSAIDEIRILGTDPSLFDTDNDGVSDGATDSDGDGLSDSFEIDNNANPFMLDTDFDGISDVDEINGGTNPGLSDTDGDGLDDLQELQSGTDPIIDDANGDLDGDGLSNIQEVDLFSSNPQVVDSNGNGINDGDEDYDLDGLSNIAELSQTLTDPIDADSNDNGVADGDEDRDNDGLRDRFEINITGTDFDVADTDGNGTSDGDEDPDGDSLSNSVELNLTQTDFNNNDSDGDGIADGDEDFDLDGLSNGMEVNTLLTDPSLIDSDEDGLNDGDEDFDLDGLSNLQEFTITNTDLIVADTDGDTILDGDEDSDGDGLSDSVELNQTLTAFDSLDSDGNGVNDPDEDSDGDGLSNILEAASLFTNPGSLDGDSDGVNDADEDFDGDGLSNIVEVALTQTDPTLVDSDGNSTDDGDEDFDNDGLSNWIETSQVQTNPSLPDSDFNGVLDLNEDFDQDGLTNIQEINLTLTDPTKGDTSGNGILDGDEDFDSDGLTNVQELIFTGTSMVDGDSDSNGTLDGDEDSDGDGLTDAVELNATQTAHNNADTDADGIADGNEDLDGDGLSNAVEATMTLTNPAAVDSDGNGISDGEEDKDQDGLPNAVESSQSLTNPALADSNSDGTVDADEDRDGDGLTNIQELNVTGTDMTVVDSNSNSISDGDEDSDGDGLTDAQELNLTLTIHNLKDSDGDGIDDGDEDLDQDGLSNIDELTVYFTNPSIFDTDGDGLSDGDEINVTGTDPFVVDTNSDGINDGDEDTDGDGLTDAIELNVTRTLVNNTDSDGDGINDDAEDKDLDGLSNLQEIVFTNTNIEIADTDNNGISDGDEDRDGDGLSDGIELNSTQTQIDVVDSDNDGTVDGDEDSDSDGLSNLVEVNTVLTDPGLFDTDSDGLSDFQENQTTLTDPLIADSVINGVNDGDLDADGDGLSDAQELNITLTDYQLADSSTPVNGIIDGDEDSDNDGLSDSVELNITLTAFDDADTDGNGTTDDAEDADLDGLTNITELNVTLTNAALADTDGDGLTDGQEIQVTFTNPLVVDSNSNGTSDGDEDTDSDGLSDAQELNTTGTNFQVVDTDGNGTIDGDEDRDGDQLSDSVELNLTQTDINVVDTDGNGVNDGDEDFDGDSLSNILEITILLTNPSLVDTDANGINDEDEDNDLDGLTNIQELINTGTDIDIADTDGNGTLDGDEDRDGDQLSDGVELNDTQTNFDVVDSDGNGVNDGDEDLDQDGLSNVYEVTTSLPSNLYLTNPALADTDGDGLSDSEEIQIVLTDPLQVDSDGNGTNDGDEDFDGDGLSNIVESNQTNTDLDNNDTDGNGTLDGNEDSDGDGISNTLEIVTLFTNPGDPDSNNNGIDDGDEDFDNDGLSNIQEQNITGTDMTNADTDGNGTVDGDEDQDSDGLNDGIELNFSQTNYNVADTDGDGINDGDEDSDGDGLSNILEVFTLFTNPGDSDSDSNGIDDGDEDFDNDGLSNIQEQNITGTDMTNADTDGNGTVDGDEDQDGDGLNDSIELNLSLTDFTVVDSDGDGINDGDEDADQDGLSNLQELNVTLTILNLADTDADSISDGNEDSDGDGLSDSAELNLTLTDINNTDSDGNGTTDDLEDPDGDTLLNAIEVSRTLTDPQQNDTDGDGILDGDEDADRDSLSNTVELTTPQPAPPAGDPSMQRSEVDKADTDGDGVDDGVELFLTFTDPWNENSVAVVDTQLDSDGDGLTDFIELTATLTDINNINSDGVGVTDDQEDLDGDGLKNFEEVKVFTSPLDVDTDGDGIADGDEDFDHDGLTNLQELLLTNTMMDVLDSDGNSVPDGSEDTDGDGLTDAFELNSSLTDFNNVDSDGDGINDNLEDFDADGLNNEEEEFFGTCPVAIPGTTCSNPSDSDNDGLSDFEESQVGTIGFSADSDGDGLSDLDEINLYFSDPTLVDGDKDGLSDVVELNIGGQTVGTFDANLAFSDPLIADTDNDGLSDLIEFEYRFDYEDLEFEEFVPNNARITADPKNPDTDGDGFGDAQELSRGTNIGEPDTDVDGLSDGAEVNGSQTNGVITSPLVRDTDDDGLLDGQEVFTTFTNPNDNDSDDDGIIDGDEDSDGDLLSDAEELNKTETLHNNVDSDGDGINDNLDDNDRLTVVDENGVETVIVVGDGISNIDEVNAGTDPLKLDTDDDGLNDDVEIILETDPLNPDSDSDNVEDGIEVNLLGTDPNKLDSDGDGLSEGEELEGGSDPLDSDTDNDFVKDGADPEPLNHDADGDGLLDGIEMFYLLSDPNNEDTDSDGLLDGQEVWMFALDDNDELVRVGRDANKDGIPDAEFNSRSGTVAWPAPEKFLTNGVDRLVFVLDDTEGNILGDLYIRRISNPNDQDSDGDLLTDYTELALIDAAVFNLVFDSQSSALFYPLTTNEEAFKVSDPWDTDTNNDGIFDGDEDFDGDFYTNFLDQEGEGTSVINPDSDFSDDGDNSNDDGLLDGLEALVILSNPNEPDTDEDGLRDDLELNGPVTYRVVVDTLLCNSTEVPVANVAGVNYCFTVNYKSYPFSKDSDADGIADLELDENGIFIDEDIYPLDASCAAGSDGFIDANIEGGRQCFASWMAEQSGIEQIRYANYQNGASEDTFEAAFYSSGWDKVVRYSGTGSYLPLLSDTTDLIRVEYSSASARLYLAYSTGEIRYYDLLTDTLNNFASLTLAGDQLNTIAVAGTNLIVQIRDVIANNFDHRIFAENATEFLGLGLSGTTFNANEYQWDESRSRLYGFDQAPISSATDLAYIGIDITANPVISAPVLSGQVGINPTLTGPIELSIPLDEIYLGSGQTFHPDLIASAGAIGSLSKSHQGISYTIFPDLKEIGGHFVGVVDSSGIDNAIFVEDLLVNPPVTDTICAFNSTGTSVTNRYLLPPVSASEQILKLLPLFSTDIFVVSRDDKAVTIELLGLTDFDGDGIPGIYERFYGLNDSDEDDGGGQPVGLADKFEDPDEDFLTNIEEFFCATDPLKEDTDGDDWFDGYEVLNETDPLDDLVF